MLLLDVPPEIFEKFIHELVSTVELIEAWKLRSVCRIFKSEIANNVIAKQPYSTRGFRIHSTSIKILELNVGLSIYFRSRVLLNAHPLLPTKINDMVEYLARELNQTRDRQMEELRQQLCDSIGEIGYPLNILNVLHHGQLSLWHAAPAASATLTTLEEIFAAISVGRHEPIQSLLLQLSDHQDHPLFGDPLRAAVVLGHERVVETMLQHLQLQATSKYSVRQALLRHGWNLRDAMVVAISKKNVDLLRILATWHSEHLPRMNKARYDDMLERAIRTLDLEGVKVILETVYRYEKHRLPERVTWANYQVTCTQGRADIVQEYIDKGYVKPNDKSLTTSPLVEAVRGNYIKVVKVLLEAGAEVNVPATYPPISVAIRMKNPDMVLYLLDAVKEGKG